MQASLLCVTEVPSGKARTPPDDTCSSVTKALFALCSQVHGVWRLGAWEAW